MIIYIYIFSIKSNNLQRDIGYCPQFDAVDPLLTGMEVLKFYSRLRGIPEKDVKEVRYLLTGFCRVIFLCWSYNGSWAIYTITYVSIELYQCLPYFSVNYFFIVLPFSTNN